MSRSPSSPPLDRHRPLLRLLLGAAALALALGAEARTLHTANGPVEVPESPERVVTLYEGALDAALAAGIVPVGAVTTRGGDGVAGYIEAHLHDESPDARPAIVGVVREINLGAVLQAVSRNPLAEPGLLGVSAGAAFAVALALGERVAAGLGHRPGRVRLAVVLVVALLVGVATAIAGPIAFVGLVVPFAARALAGPDIRRTLWLCLPLGPLMVLADLVGRLLLAPIELPVGIVTAVIGGPWLLWILLRPDSRSLR
jgi:iron complex transport system permease protein